MTSSNGNIFRVTGLLCGDFHRSPVNSPQKRSMTRGFDVFFDLRLNKRLSKQRWDWWLETSSRPLWRHCNVLLKLDQSHASVPDGYDFSRHLLNHTKMMIFVISRRIYCAYNMWITCGINWGISLNEISVKKKQLWVWATWVGSRLHKMFESTTSNSVGAF